MIQFLSRSISRKILASFVGLYLTTYLLTALVVFTGVRASIVDSEMHALSQLADLKIERSANALRDAGINLKAWSELEVMNDLVSGDIDKRVARTLEGLKRQYHLDGEIYAFDTAGKLIASSSPAALTIGITEMPAAWHVNGGREELIDKHPNPMGQGDAIALICPAKASFSSDFTLGFLVLTYPWASIELLLFGDGARTVLVKAGDGDAPEVLAADFPLDQARQAAAETDGHAIAIGGEPFVAGRSQGVVSFPRGWTVLALRQTDVVVRSVHRVAVQLLLLGLFLSIPIVIGVRWLSRKLTGPVVALTGFVREIADTDRLDKRAPVSSDDELGTLARSFNTMTESLERAAGERERFVQELETLNRTLEGKVADRTRALETANGEMAKAFDELKSAQSQLVQSEKMASLGQLVAGVAHELNNPIAFIYANFPHLEEYATDLLALIAALRAVPSAPDEARRAEDLVARADLDFVAEDILKIIHSGKDGVSRVKEIVRSLRSFSRLDEAEFKPVLLEDGLDDTLAILHHHMKGRITLTRDYQLREPVSCFPGQINQVFMNIVFNAIQAIDGPGSIAIATRRENDWAVVSIADSGAGIPPELVAKIFDPFFTTKKVGEGTGLGLSISYGIIEKHQGRIDVASRPGQGTTFELRLPLTAQPPQGEA